MILFTQKDRKNLPPLYAQNGKDEETIAYVKLFTPDSQWTWYILEFDGDDTMFGYVEGLEKELGYISLKEIQSIRGPLGLPVERDLYFKPTKLSEIAPQLFRKDSE